VADSLDNSSTSNSLSGDSPLGDSSARNSSVGNASLDKSSTELRSDFHSMTQNGDSAMPKPQTARAATTSTEGASVDAAPDRTVDRAVDVAVGEQTSSISPHPFLSIILPAYNEEQRLPPTLVRVAEFLRKQPYTAEVLVVENGSTDRTVDVVRNFQAEGLLPDDPFEVHLLQSAKGKGNAIRHGIMAGRGEYLLISDTDLAVPIEEVNQFLPPALAENAYAIAIASREIEGAVRHGEPFYRHLMGRVFNTLVRLLAIPGIHDTQCGFKVFRRSTARRIFPLQRIEGWGFDVEVLYIAQKHGLPIVEVPVNWYYGQDSRVRPIHDTFTMIRDLIEIRRNGRAGHYDELIDDDMAGKD
jgi:dolichyl-phosphate beta-glucosyltransferase